MCIRDRYYGHYEDAYQKVYGVTLDKVKAEILKAESIETVSYTHLHSFKKGDIVLTNDFELFEVKTRHKNNTVSLYKNNNKKRVDIKEIIGTVVGYYKYK